MNIEILKKYFSTLFVLFVSLFSLVIIITGVYYKYTKLIKGNNISLFFRKNLGIAFTTMVFTIFTILISVMLNNVFLTCPDYEKNPEHPWFKKHIMIQITDIFISLSLIVILKYLLTIIITNSIEYFIKQKSFNYIKYLYTENHSAKEKVKLLDIRQKGGNVTTAFITLIFQNKLRNKINYMAKYV
jgi:hypothetical protein